MHSFAESMARGRVWSLWDMMELYAPGLVVSIFNLGILSERVIRVADESKAQGEIYTYCSAEHLQVGLHSCAEISALAKRLQYRASEAASDRCLLLLAGGKKVSANQIMLETDKLHQFGHQLNYLSTAITDELRGTMFFGIQSDHRAYLEGKDSVFGQGVDDAFLDAMEDVSEAAKCLALGRSTAVVFHLMRAMEVSVQALASSLGVTSVEKEWGKLLSDISKAIEPMPKGDNRDAWSEAHSHLYHVKQAWRNSTMHPKKTYTEDEARVVFDAVGSFMRHLAPLVSSAQ